MTYIPKYFTVNSQLDKYLPRVRFFLLDLKRSVDLYIDSNNVENQDFKLLPSWTKFSKNPLKAKGWFSHVIQGIFNGQHNLNELNSDYIINEAHILKNENESDNGRKVSMIFFGDNIRIKNLDIIAEIVKQSLPNFEIIVLHGQKTNQYKAEKLVKGTLERLNIEGNYNKPVLILSAKLGQRSFTIKEITEIYLAYDGGSIGTTIQKISRALSPDFSNKDKVGNIFSLSFDSNRDDKIDSHIITAALNIVDKKRTDFKEALRMILNSIDIFSSNTDGLEFINNDAFIEDTMSRGSISRTIGTVSDLFGLDHDILVAIAQGNKDFKKDDILDKARKGRTTDSHERPPKAPSEGKNNENTNSSESKLMSDARAAIISMIEDFHIIFKATNCITCESALNKCKKEMWDESIFNEFGITLDLILYLILETRRVRPEWIESLHNKIIVKISNLK